MKLFDIISYKFRHLTRKGFITGIRDKGVWVESKGFDPLFVPWDRIVNEN